MPFRREFTFSLWLCPKAPLAICSINIAAKPWGKAKAKLTNSPQKIHSEKASYNKVSPTCLTSLRIAQSKSSN